MLGIYTTEGLNFVQRLAFKSGTLVPNWYFAPYEGDYTPTPGLTAAQFPLLATECTAYEATSRPLFAVGDVVAGSVNNYDAVAQVRMTAAKRIYGVALMSAPAKGGTGGVCMGALRLPTPQDRAAGELLEFRLNAFAVSAP